MDKLEGSAASGHRRLGAAEQSLPPQPPPPMAPPPATIAVQDAVQLPKQPMEAEGQKPTEAKECPSPLLDVEDILSSRQIARSEIRCPNMPPQRLRDMLENDVQLRTVKKPVPFLRGQTAEGPSDCMGETERDLLHWYERDYAVIDHRWDELSTETNARRTKALRANLARELAPQIYADAEGVGQPPNVSLGGPKRGKTVAVAEEAAMAEQRADEWRATTRAKDRGSVLANLMPPEIEGGFLESHNDWMLKNCWTGQIRLSTTFSRASLGPSVDALFISAALYDVRQRRKVSEDFRFDSTENPPRALFSLPRGCDEKGADSLVLFFRLEKTLQRGGLETALEAFSKRPQAQSLRGRNASTAIISAESNNASHRIKFRQQIGLVAVPLARTPPHRSFTDSMVQATTSVAALDVAVESDNTNGGVARSATAEDSISECSTSTAERFSCSAIPLAPVAPLPPRLVNSSSWTVVSNPSATTAAGDRFPHNPTQLVDGCWVRKLSERSVSVRINYFVRSEPMPETELLDWLASTTAGHQQPRGDRVPVDIHFDLEIVRMEELSARSFHVWSPELSELNLANISEGADHLKIDPNHFVPPSIAIDLLPFPTSQMAFVHTFPRHLLFVYPRSANFTARTGQNARNISVKAELFNGRMERRIEEAFVADGRLAGEVFSTVQYHSRHAQFGGTEWKLIMPWGSKEGFYLRFTFLHISCKPRGDDTKIMGETPIGFSWLPLQLDGSDSAPPSGEHRLPISLDVPPPALCFLSPHVNVPDVHWLDSHRPLFHLHVVPVSSIQPQDSHLNAFLITSRAFLRPPPLSPVCAADQTLSNSIRNVLKCSPEQMLSFLHIILHRLLAIITAHSSDASPGPIAFCAFETLCQLTMIITMLLDGTVDTRNRSRLLLEFVRLERLSEGTEEGEERDNGGEEAVWKKREQEQEQDKQNNNNISDKNNNEKPTLAQDERPRAHLHHQLVRLFISSSGHSRESACTSGWFLLSLVHRSLVEHFDQTQGHLLPRKMRFGGADFLAELAELGGLLVAEVLERVAKNAAQAGAINLAWAQFLRDSVALLSRGWIIEQMKQHCETIDSRIELLTGGSNAPICAQLLSMKLAFLRVLLSQQHFLFLSLPFPVALPTPEGSKKAKQFLFGSSSSGVGTLRKSATNLATAQKRSSPKGTNGKKDGNLLTKSATSLLFVPPPSSSVVPGSHPLRLFADLSAEHRLRHLPIFLLLSQLHALLRVRSSLCSPYVSLLHSLIATHENDWRLTGDGGEWRQRVAIMYSPLLGIVLELLELDWLDMNIAERDRRDEWAKKDDKDSGLASEEEERNSHKEFSPGNTTTAMNRRGGTTQKKLLLCVCWLLRSLPVPALLVYLRQLPFVQLRRFVRLLRSLLSTFARFSPVAFPRRRHSVDSFVHLIGGAQFCQWADEYDVHQQFLPDKRRQSVETTSISTLGDANAAVPRGDELRATDGTDNNKNNTTTSSSTSFVKWRMGKRNSSDDQLEKALSCQLSAEVLLLVLDQLELLFQLSSPQLMSELLGLLLFALSGHHSLQSLHHLFRTLRAFVRKFSEFLLTETDKQLLTALCQQMLRHMTAELAEVRQQAVMSTLALLKIAFRHSKGGFVRLNRCLTTALCCLVSNCVASGKALDDSALRASLESITPEAKKTEKAEFLTQLEHVVANLNAILSDTFKLSTHIDDFEMTIDLMHRIAHGYRNNPELRIAWLLGIARKHLEERKTFAEAAQCLLHCCAIVATKLLNTGTVDDELLPRSVFDAFEELSENVREEWEGKRGDVVARGEERRTNGIIAGGHFTLSAFTKMVEKMANLFERAQLFELVANVFKLVLPLHERTHAHVKLIQAHTQIVSCLSRVDPPVLIDGTANLETATATNGAESAMIVPLNGTDKRCFGTYFRVRFFGAKCDELDGKEFVYKEPAITKLAEISARLEQFYMEKLGRETVVMMKDSNEVDVVRLDPDKAYLQITFVEPHFERWERRRRQTHSERSYRLRQFVYATPFTQNGKAHGPLEAQWKRKTVLGLENSFPYVKTRLRVIERRQTDLCPMEVAIEDIQKRTRELRWAMCLEPRDVKMLQMQLQGCIGTTVNQGPVEIARVFLADANLDADGMPRESLQRRLRLCFDELSRTCNEALEVNERHMEADREEYKRELRRNMCRFEESLAKVLKNGKKESSMAVPCSMDSAAAPSPAELVQALAIAGRIGPVSSV
uniref:Uncharacterized protein n=1 Tax=Globodera rostochiensis TaxID=31243 RepID=A0A914ICA2_GLORO